MRDEVNIPNVEWELGEDGVGIIQISHFSDHTARPTSKALAEFARLAEAGQPFSGVVLDLRSNTGGSLIQSAETVDLFVDSGEIVRTDGRDGAAVPKPVRSLRLMRPLRLMRSPRSRWLYFRTSALRRPLRL